jgi:hypothetical protein
MSHWNKVAAELPNIAHMENGSIRSSNDDALHSNHANDSMPTIPRSSVHIPSNRRRQGLAVKQISFRQAVMNASLKASRAKRMKVLVALTILGFLVMFICWFWLSPQDFSIANNDTFDSNGTVTGKKRCHPSMNAFYFMATTLTSTGYGDICPISPAAKFMTSIFQIFAWSISLGAVWYLSDGIKAMKEKVNAVITKTEEIK